MPLPPGHAAVSEVQEGLPQAAHRARREHVLPRTDRVPTVLGTEVCTVKGIQG